MAKLGGLFQNKSKRPRIRPTPTGLDRILWMTAINLALAGPVYAAWVYAGLPARIPTGFGPGGQVGGMGPAWNVLLAPGFGVIVVGVMLLLQRWPWISNTVVAITEENAEAQYRLVNRLLSWLAIVMGVIFLMVTIEVATTAQGQPAKLAPPIMAMAAAGTLPLLAWYLWRSFKEA